MLFWPIMFSFMEVTCDDTNIETKDIKPLCMSKSDTNFNIVQTDTKKKRKFSKQWKRWQIKRRRNLKLFDRRKKKKNKKSRPRRSLEKRQAPGKLKSKNIQSKLTLTVFLRCRLTINNKERGYLLILKVGFSESLSACTF